MARALELADSAKNLNVKNIVDTYNVIFGPLTTAVIGAGERIFNNEKGICNNPLVWSYKNVGNLAGMRGLENL
ncbi:MAG: hypothetical protein CBB68_05105 [Rhodospirillaceae bacterium TMED8]|nr:hypothetical protein [Magnetovibrio sp.]OUT51704.1 MAG: hypothetical protein CBB68_05105 [Rhodospirillaceae bacterium TMED8]|tara:strand:- start:186 stop:404 length:219 start_codon:yes stop_codon:yes gene_type:complete